MHILGKLRALVGAVPRAGVRREARKFLAATADCRGTQHRVLRHLLRLNAESRFSRRHGLHRVRTVADLRKHLPVTDYEFYRAPIEQLKTGNFNSLLGPKNRLLMFSLSSGTTSDSKFIPITQRFFEDYRRGWQIWGIHALDDHPDVNARKIVQLSSDYDRYRTPGGTPCGNISGLVAAMQKPIVRTMYTVPGIVSKITEPEAKYYTTLRLAVADDNVGMVMTANPSTLIHLAKLADLHREELIRDVADGTLSRRYAVPPRIRETLRRRISRRRPARAHQLESIVERTGRFYPRDFWPENQIVAVWTGGSAGIYLHSLRRFYGEASIRDHGLSASEGRMTIPLQDGHSRGVLDVTTHFFEFIPEEQYDSNNPQVLEAHELQPGRNYYILLTTSSGLYRYNICDVVRCAGFCGTTPLLEFLHKGAHISNLTGEKVSESQVVAAVRHCLERMQIHLKHFTVSPVWGDPPHYQLLTEESDVPSPAVGHGLARKVDDQLQRLNCEYREKRQTGRLDNMSWVPLPEGTWRKFARDCQSKFGGSLEQYKHPCLVPDLKFSAQLILEHAMPDAPGTAPLSAARSLTVPRSARPVRTSAGPRSTR